MRILYGGTFDPVHEGHLAIARAVATAFGANVSLLPAADPPHRAVPGASAEQRAHMLDLAIACDRCLSVDRRELHRDGPSYTVDTLEQIRGEIGPALPLVWVLGIDSLLQLDTWHDWRRILALAHIVGVERPGTSVEQDWLRSRAPDVHCELSGRWSVPGELEPAAAGRYAPLPMRPLRLESASEVRRRIAEGLPWQDMVPAPVARYIQDQDLYRPAQNR